MVMYYHTFLNRNRKTVRTAGWSQTTHIPYIAVVYYNHAKPRDLDS